MNIEITRGQLKDLTSIAQLFDLYRQFYQQPADITLATEFIQQRLEHQDSIIFLAKNEDQEALGFIQLYPSFSSVSALKTWILNDLFVVHEYRQFGVAKALLTEAQKHAQKSGAKGLSLMTSQNNLAAQKLYLSMGYIKQDFFSYFLNCQQG